MPERDTTTGPWRFIDQMSLVWLVPLAIFVAMAPWPMGPQPHLVEKFGMLQAGTLTKPLDIFDVFWHGAAMMVTFVKLGRVAYLKTRKD